LTSIFPRIDSFHRSVAIKHQNVTLREQAPAALASR